jgi:hypothetical protein
MQGQCGAYPTARRGAWQSRCQAQVTGAAKIRDQRALVRGAHAAASSNPSPPPGTESAVANQPGFAFRSGIWTTPTGGAALPPLVPVRKPVRLAGFSQQAAPSAKAETPPRMSARMQESAERMGGNLDCFAQALKDGIG